MKKALHFLLTLGIFGFAAASTEKAAYSQALVIQGGTLIDGNGGEPVRDALIIIEGDRFQAVTTVGKAQVPAGAQVVLAEGKYILPGLIDSHVHLADWHFELFLAHGVTTLVDLAGVPEWTIAEKEGVAKGKIRGPRIFVTTPAINGPDFPATSRNVLYGTAARATSDSEENLALVRGWIAQGVDVVKFHWTIPVDIVRTMAGEAKRVGLPTVCHCDLNILLSVPAGIQKSEHATGIAEAIINDPAKWAKVKETRIPGGHPYSWDWYFVDPKIYGKRIDEIIQFLIKNNVHVEPTLESSWKGVYPESAEFLAYDMNFLHSHPELLEYIPPSSQFMFTNYSIEEGAGEKHRERIQIAYRNFHYFIRRFVELGGKLDVDSDQSKDSIAGVSYHNEMILVQSAGLTPMQVIVGATKNPADFMGKLKDLGTIEKGKLADLIIVTKDPVADIRNIKDNIETVIIGGKVMDISYHQDYSNPIPSHYLQGVYLDEVPELDYRIVPRVGIEGSEAITVSIKGKYFRRDSQAYFKGVPVPTRLVDSSTLDATLAPSLLREVGTWPLAVSNPRPGGGLSEPVYFMVKFR